MRHFRQFVLQSEFAVVGAGAVKKAFDVAAVGIQGGFEFRERRWRLADGPDLVWDAVLGEPFQGVAAGTAVFVSVNGAHGWKIACELAVCKARFALMKLRVIEKIRVELRAQLERLSKAAQEAHAAATDPGSKAEGKYDTRSLEASYLAAGQARQVDELAASVRIFENLQLVDFELDSEIDSGALVEVDLRGERGFFLLVPAAGGMVIVHEGEEITLLTPESLLYRKLLGLKCGESLDEPPLRVVALS